MKSDNKLWKSSKKNGFSLFIYVLFTLIALWFLASEGIDWFYVLCTLFLGVNSFVNIRTHLQLSALERKVNADLTARGYANVMDGVTSVFGDSRKFVGFVYNEELYKAVGESGKYFVGLSTVEGVTCYHFGFLTSDAKWVAVVDGRNVQYFTN